MASEIQSKIERKKTKITKEEQVILKLQEKLERRASVIRENQRNYQITWFKPDGTFLSDSELSIPDLYWQPTGYGMGLNRIAYWSTVPTEDLGFNGDYSGPADERRTRILNLAEKIKRGFTLSYERRQLDKRTFERNLQSAIKNLTAAQIYRKTKDDWYHNYDFERDQPMLDDWEIQLKEHLTTSYSYPLKAPYQARQITSSQLQLYLGEMEKKNPSESLRGGKE